MAKVALITGGASGMGLAVAKSLNSIGWNIVIADMNTSMGEKAAETINASFYRTNVTDYRNLADTFAKTWKEHGRLDFVFANAGIVERANFYERQSSDADGLPPEPNLTVMDVDLSSVITTAYLALHFFRKNTPPGGSLVITASSGGIYPSQYLPMYSAAKHGCVGFVRSIASEMRKEDVRVNCICPGAVATGLLDQKEWDRFPQELFTPIEKVVEVVKMLIDHDEIYGQAAEIIQNRHYFRAAPEFLDEAMKKVMAATDVE